MRHRIAASWVLIIAGELPVLHAAQSFQQGVVFLGCFILFGFGVQNAVEASHRP